MTAGTSLDGLHKTLASTTLLQNLCKTSLMRISSEEAKSTPSSCSVSIIDEGLELYLDVMVIT